MYFLSNVKVNGLNYDCVYSNSCIGGGLGYKIEWNFKNKGVIVQRNGISSLLT